MSVFGLHLSLFIIIENNASKIAIFNMFNDKKLTSSTQSHGNV